MDTFTFTFFRYVIRVNAVADITHEVYLRVFLLGGAAFSETVELRICFNAHLDEIASR